MSDRIPTWMTDKNGKVICEGDIVLWCHGARSVNNMGNGWQPMYSARIVEMREEFTPNSSQRTVRYTLSGLFNGFIGTEVEVIPDDLILSEWITRPREIKPSLFYDENGFLQQRTGDRIPKEERDAFDHSRRAIERYILFGETAQINPI